MAFLSFLNGGSSFVDGIRQRISDEFRDWIWVCGVSQAAFLIFQDVKEGMRSVSVESIRVNRIGGAMILLRLL
jgi:hypothetical protein